MLQEFHVKGLKMGEVKPRVYDIDTMAHEFNFFTMNGKFSLYNPFKVKLGENVRSRLGNIASLTIYIKTYYQWSSILCRDLRVLKNQLTYLLNQNIEAILK